MKNLYEILNVVPGASERELKKAYHALALVNHPDKAGGSAEVMKDLIEAYSTLKDPHKRAEYELNWSLFQALGDDVPRLPVSGYIHNKDVLPFSHAYKQEHNNLIVLGQKIIIKRFLAREALNPFGTELYSWDNISYSDLISYIETKSKASQETELKTELKKKPEPTLSPPTSSNLKNEVKSTYWSYFSLLSGGVSRLFGGTSEEDLENQEDQEDQEDQEEQKDNHSNDNSSPVFKIDLPDISHVSTAIDLFTQLLSGQYYGERLKQLYFHFKSHIETLKGAPGSASELQIYEALFTVIDTMFNKQSPKNYLPALGKIVTYAKESNQADLKVFLDLFCNSYYRAFYAYAQHQHWNMPLDLFDIHFKNSFNGYEQGIKNLEQLKAQLKLSGVNTHNLKAAQQLKLVISLEKALQLTHLEHTAVAFREHGFNLLDWIPAFKEYLTPAVYANLFIQIGIKFQQASVLESNLAIKHADEQLALKMYLSAFTITEKAAPDLTLYVIGLITTFISQFVCENKLVMEVLPELQKKYLMLADVFPCFDGIKSNIAFLTKEDKTLSLMRSMLNNLHQRYQYNKTHSDKKALEYQETTVLYQIYEACLLNWYKAQYDPNFEKEIRLALMDELLLDNLWGALDVEQHLDSLWVNADRDTEGWLQPTDSLPYPSNLVTYKRIDGFQVNHKTGNISFFLEPWTQNDLPYEKLFTSYDVQEMMAKNLGSGFFSLDPVDPLKPFHPFNAMRFAPQGLADSSLMSTMLLTDYILKFMTTGQEVQGIYPFDQRPIAEMLSHLPQYLKLIIERYRQAEHSGAIHRFWIEAEEIDLDMHADEATDCTNMSLGEVRMVVKKHRMVRDINGALKDASHEDEGWPIYVMTPDQMQLLQAGTATLAGHAMIFILNTNKVFYWENNAISKEHEAKIIKENFARLYHESRNANGLVPLTSKNAPLLVKITRDVAKQTKMPDRYSAEFIFAHDFTAYYNEFAQYLPEFGRLRELSRLSVMVRMLNSIRLNNNQKLNALNAVIGEQENPEQTESYEHYKRVDETFKHRVKEQNSHIRQQLSDIEEEQIEKLTSLKRAHGFNSLQEQEGLAAAIAQQQNLYKREVVSLVDDFVSGNPVPLAKKLTEKVREKILESTIGELRKQIPGSTYGDLYEALGNNKPSFDRTIAKKAFAALTKEEMTSCEHLQKAYKKLSFAEQEESEDEVKETCYWVPASIKHEVKDKEGYRYSFFVYGGVNLQTKINVNQRDQVYFSRQAVVRGFQDHHIVSNKNQRTGNHGLWQLAGINPNSRLNKIYLPVNANQHPTRSLHLGRHTDAYSKQIAEKMTQLKERGKSSGWTQSQYREATREFLAGLRQDLRNGNIALNKHYRPWANK